VAFLLQSHANLKQSIVKTKSDKASLMSHQIALFAQAHLLRRVLTDALGSMFT
jgi:hypothetical protein